MPARVEQMIKILRTRIACQGRELDEEGAQHALE
jgi:hypothetical protein